MLGKKLLIKYLRTQSYYKIYGKNWKFMLKYLGIKEGSVPLIGCYNACI
jgi:hypothetical protein